jgi:hypothetical protein
MFTRRHFSAAVLVIASGVVASPAWAAPPTNDTSAGATAATIGFSQSLDTSQATTDAQDTQANADCGAPATDASVWYTVAGTGSGVVVDVSASDYSAGVIVATGTPGNLELVTCGAGTVGFTADTGTTYYVLAFDDQEDGTGNGGHLSIAFSAAPPPPTVDVTVNPRGTVSTRTGVAHLSGTYTCSDADSIDIFGDVCQPVGRFTIRGSFDIYSEGTCDGTPQSWTADVIADNGKFAGGKALTVAFSFACGVLECTEGYTEQTVRLSGGR